MTTHPDPTLYLWLSLIPAIAFGVVSLGAYLERRREAARRRVSRGTARQAP